MATGVQRTGRSERPCCYGGCRVGCWKGLGSERHSPKFPWSGENRLGPSKSHSVPGRWSCAWLLTLKATKGAKTLSWTRPSTRSHFPASFQMPRKGQVSVLSSYTGVGGAPTLSPPGSGRGRAPARRKPVLTSSVQCLQIWFGPRFCQLL